ncbi:MAG: transcriptional regulator, partial [Ignavibacterium sp.]|nr:transcriptional regulator [Ignavibacterium sp.]
MFDFQTKIKRQIEILGFCIYNSAQKPLRTIDLAEFFNVEELTIKRDLQDLRSYGIDIHSDKKRGVCLTSEPSREKIVEIILQYMSLSHNEYGIDKTTSLLVKKRGLNSLSNIVMLQRCIDNSAIAIIDYNKVGNKIDKGREIEPLLIIQHEGTWRLIAGSEGIIKQFILEKIVRVQTSDKKFKKESYNLSNLFNYSWKTWVSNEKFFIKLWLSKFWADRIEPRILVFEQKLTQNEDGSVIFECVVNSLNEIASWIVSRGEGVKVLEPKELREIVINLAIGA